MDTLFLFITATVFAIGPDVDGHPTRNPAVPPTVTQSIVRAGTFPNWTACNQVAEIIHDRKTAYADVATEAHCLELAPASPDHDAALAPEPGR